MNIVMTNWFAMCHYNKIKSHYVEPVKREEIDHEKILEENDQIRKLLNIANVYPKIRKQSEIPTIQVEKRFNTDQD